MDTYLSGILFAMLTLLAPGYLGCIEAPGVAPEAPPIEMPFLFRYKP